MAFGEGTEAWIRRGTLTEMANHRTSQLPRPRQSCSIPESPGTPIPGLASERVLCRPLDLSICILTRSQPLLLPQCVSSCVAEMKRAGACGEIILIDNASSDAYPQAVAKRFPDVRVIRNEQNLDFSPANNEAIRASRGHFVLILNDDTALQEGSLGLLLEQMHSNPRIGAVGPKLLNLDGSPQLGFTNRRFPNLRSLLCHTLTLEGLLQRNALTRDTLTLVRDPDRTGETDHLAGACLLIRREALDAVGLFDERFQFWYEDVDLCRRLKAAGWSLAYVANARVTHYGSASFEKRSAVERDAIYYRSLKYFWKKHHSLASFQIMKITVAGALLARTWVGALRRSLDHELTLEERRAWRQARFRVARTLLGASD